VSKRPLTPTSISSETRVSKEAPPETLVSDYDERLTVRERKHAADVIQRGGEALSSGAVPLWRIYRAGAPGDWYYSDERPSFSPEDRKNVELQRIDVHRIVTLTGD
jgi:hypothetical protein